MRAKTANTTAQYGAAHIKVLIDNIAVEGFTAIEYKEDSALEPIYASGNLPQYVGIGNHEFSGSLTLLVNELIALQDAARATGIQSGDITSLQPFTIIVSYTPILGSEGSPVVDILNDCMFKGNGRSISQGDTKIEHSIDLFIGSINWGVV